MKLSQESKTREGKVAGLSDGREEDQGNVHTPVSPQCPLTVLTAVIVDQVI